MPIWSSSYIAQLASDAEIEIAKQLKCLWARSSIAITSGTATYTLPARTFMVTAVTWKGIHLEAISQEQLKRLDSTYLTNRSIPRWYTIDTDGFSTIRFYPVPNETISAVGDAYGTAATATNVIISYYYTPVVGATTLLIPSYIGRRVIKNYVCHHAFRAEGLGQNIRASDAFLRKWEFNMKHSREIALNIFRAKRRDYSDFHADGPARPMLPANFGMGRYFS